MYIGEEGDSTLFTRGLPNITSAMLTTHVVQIHPDGRRMYIGEEGDSTMSGVPNITGATLKRHVVQIHPDGRRMYIGEEGDSTRNGEVIMSHNKAFKSLPIRSWTGGAKVRPAPARGCQTFPALRQPRQAPMI